MKRTPPIAVLLFLAVGASAQQPLSLASRIAAHPARPELAPAKPWAKRFHFRPVA